MSLVALFFLVCGLNIALSAKIVREYDPHHDECAFDHDDRLPCGRLHDTLGELECFVRGCCFDNSRYLPTGVPRCYLAHRMLQQACAVEYEDKNDCGYYGIREGECISRGCCWQPSERVNDPWCFKKSNNMIRLVQDVQEAAKVGRVEIMHDGEWGTVCDDNFDDNAAQVVCKALGYYGGVAQCCAANGEGSGQIWLDDFQCNGTEDSLAECSHIQWGQNDCSHSEDASVFCVNEGEEVPTPTPYYYYESEPEDIRDKIRLMMNDEETEMAGRLEFFIDRTWGTMCDDNFDDDDAKVVCKTLGYHDGVAQCCAENGEGSGPIWADGLQCSGTEESIVDCNPSNWGQHTCSHSDDVSIICVNEDESQNEVSSGFKKSVDIEVDEYS